ncbi:hypothetical protein ACSBR1_018532 [Camellia fascicularis]
MAISCRPLTLFSDLNDSLIENVEASSFEPRQSASAPAPILSFHMLNLKKQNKELKRKTTSAAQFGGPWCPSFEGRWGVISFGSSANAEAESSKASRE